MYRVLLLAAVLALAGQPVWAQDNGLIIKQSSFDVSETLDRLEALFGDRGIGVAARVDHAAAAEKAGLKLNPNQVLIFGNPNLGTPLMESNPTIGIDLPLKVLSWEDDAGTVWVAYNDPGFLSGRHAITDRDEGFAQMAKVLDTLTSAATTP